MKPILSSALAETILRATRDITLVDPESATAAWNYAGTDAVFARTYKTMDHRSRIEYQVVDAWYLGGKPGMLYVVLYDVSRNLHGCFRYNSCHGRGLPFIRHLLHQFLATEPLQA